MAKTIEIRGFPHVYDLTASTDTAPVLVFVHGWLLSREYWQPIIQALAPSYQCLSYDLRGFGRSQAIPKPTATASVKERSPELIHAGAQSFASAATLSEPSGFDAGTSEPLGYTPAAYAEDLVTLLKQLKISNAWLVGHSLGGSIALWAADLAPRLVQGVICVNSGGGIYLKEEFERFRGAGQQLVKFRPQWLCRLPLIDHAMSRLSVAAPIAREWARQRLLDLVAAHPEAALGSLLDSTTETEVHRLPQVVSRLQQPVHFIAGANDPIMEPKYVQHLASFHRSFECCGNNVTEIPNCGHMAMIEQPDAVVACIQRILEQHLRKFA